MPAGNAVRYRRRHGDLRARPPDMHRPCSSERNVRDHRWHRRVHRSQRQWHVHRRGTAGLPPNRSRLRPGSTAGRRCSASGAHWQSELTEPQNDAMTWLHGSFPHSVTASWRRERDRSPLAWRSHRQGAGGRKSRIPEKRPAKRGIAFHPWRQSRPRPGGYDRRPPRRCEVASIDWSGGGGRQYVGHAGPRPARPRPHAAATAGRRRCRSGPPEPSLGRSRGPSSASRKPIPLGEHLRTTVRTGVQCRTTPAGAPPSTGRPERYRRPSARLPLHERAARSHALAVRRRQRRNPMKHGMSRSTRARRQGQET